MSSVLPLPNYSTMTINKHLHHLYLAVYFDELIYRCAGYNRSSGFAAECNDCYYFPLEFKCVNLPKLVIYKCDTHPLTLYHEDRIVEPLEWWREICEKNLNKKKLVYTSHDCCTTLHVRLHLRKIPLFEIWP